MKLKIGNIPVKDVVLGSQDGFENGVLTINIKGNRIYSRTSTCVVHLIIALCVGSLSLRGAGCKRHEQTKREGNHTKLFHMDGSFRMKIMNQVISASSIKVGV